MASLGVSLDGRGSGQSDSVGCEPRHCASKDTLSEPELAHVFKCVLGRQQEAQRITKVCKHRTRHHLLTENETDTYMKILLSNTCLEPRVEQNCNYAVAS